MLGIPDPGIWLALLLCVGSSLLCVVYGILKWNAGDDEELVSPEDTSWEDEEARLDSEF